MAGRQRPRQNSGDVLAVFGDPEAQRALQYLERLGQALVALAPLAKEAQQLTQLLGTLRQQVPATQETLKALQGQVQGERAELEVIQANIAEAQQTEGDRIARANEAVRDAEQAVQQQEHEKWLEYFATIKAEKTAELTALDKQLADQGAAVTRLEETIHKLQAVRTELLGTLAED